MQRILLDTDLAMGAPGSDIDDGFALALALTEPGIAVEAVTTVNGNTDVQSATWLTLELLHRLGRTDIPVHKGAASPLTRPDAIRFPEPGIADRYGFRTPAAGHASLTLSERLSAEPGEITLVGIGPLTNIATALSLDPGLAAAAKEIVVMGGVFQGQTGQGSMPGEFNIWTDPEAAEAVLRCGAHLRFVGLDVTRMVRLTRAQAVRLGQAPADSFRRFAAESAIAWMDHLHARFPGDPAAAGSCAMHDPLAVAVVSHPELVTWRPAHVKVVTGDSLARGVMVTDLLESEDPPEPNCQIAVSVDADAFVDYFLGALSRI